MAEPTPKRSAERPPATVAPASTDEPGTPSARPRTRGGRRPKRSRAEILDAGARVFSAKGYEVASIQDIADDLGILKGSLYYHIKSKEDLLYEILLRGHEEILALINRSLALRGEPLERVRAFVTEHVESIAGDDDAFARLAIFFHDFRALTPERQRTIIGRRDEYQHGLRDMIIEGQQTGAVCPDIDANVIAIEILGMMNWIYNWYRLSGPQSPSALANTIADFVVAGLACDPATHEPGHRRRLAAGAEVPELTPATDPTASGHGRRRRWFLSGGE